MRQFGFVLVLSIALTLGVASGASAASPGGWERLGTGATTSLDALNNDALALNTDVPGQLIAGGKFTNAGGVAAADRIASWNGTAWSALGPADTFTSDVRAVEAVGGKVYAGGSFINAGGNAAADFLAVWNGASWAPFCSGSPLTGNVDALLAIGNTLYVGGEFQDGAGIASADYMLACDLATGTATSVTPLANTGPVYALTSDGGGRLYAGGNFQNFQGNTASDYVASFMGGTWSPLGVGPGLAFGHVTGIVRSLASDGTNVYVGSDGNDIAGIPQADHIARWNGAAWSAVGANATGTDGYLPSAGGTSVYALLAGGGHVYATGNWVNVGGDPLADFIADFDGGGWRTIGSNGAGDGPIAAKGEALAMFGSQLHAGGNFTEAGGDPLAGYLARYTAVTRPPLPSNLIFIGRVKFIGKKGTAVLSVTVPGAGDIVLAGTGIKSVARGSRPRAQRQVDGAGVVNLTVKPNGKTKKKLKKKGKAKVTARITFTPTGGEPSTETKKLKLRLKRG